jgi:ATP-dependent Lhr-like helicase
VSIKETVVTSDPTTAYARLHPGVQRWVWNQGWDRLRSVQAEAVDPVLSGSDLVVAAATASGKTEAAWLPVCSAIAAANDDGTSRTGVKALYLGPLKALINDQALRLEGLGELTDIPVHRWHGDVAGSSKRTVVNNPDGILLITPESLEALFVREGTKVATMFAGLRYIVIDELHSFIGIERGAQLQSLLHRIDLAVRRRVPRIGLSATLADLSIAADFLRPGHAESVTILDNPDGDTAEIKLQLRGYTKPDPAIPQPNTAGATDVAADPDADEAIHPTDDLAIGNHLFKTLRGHDNLVFANSRAKVEAYSDILDKFSHIHRVPNEFFPHHGNLSKEYREDVERRLRATDTPATAICTSTLEMGIDIGSTDSVAQIGAPGSVASLRQRLGRSGRRDQSAVLRMYVAERELSERTPPPDQVRAQLVQSIAMVNLMLEEHWYEPPNTADLHMSTLTQQILSVIAQHGGATAAELYTTLCATGPFSQIDRPTFLELLRNLGQSELLTQSSDGLLLHGPVGDKIVNHYSFYSAFQTSEEYRLVVRGRTLGSIPVDYPVLVGSLLIFTGRRWRVIDVDTKSRVIELTRSSGGRPPLFSGGTAEVADLVRQRMRRIYESDVVPTYLNAPAQGLLDEGRASYHRLLLGERELVGWGADTLVFCWRGDRILNTLAVALNQAGLRVSIGGVALTITRATTADVLDTITAVLAAPQPPPEELAASVLIKEREKYDEFLSDDLLARGYAAANLDVSGAWETLRHLASTQSREADPDSWSFAAVSPAEQATPAVLGVTAFAVVDVETTGFASQDDDRIIELAVVHCDPAGNITGRWTTLVAPDRDPGPTHVHGLTADDLNGAPAFADLTDWLAGLLDGRVVVAHNAPFDLAFLAAEHERADIDAPGWASLCTLELARRIDLTSTRSLQGCCAAADITVSRAHSALGDAEATAELLAHCLSVVRAKGITDLSDLGCLNPLPTRTHQGTRGPRLLPRTTSRPPGPEAISMAQLILRARATTSDTGPSNSYLAMVDSVVVASTGTRAEVKVPELVVSAARFGLDASDAAKLLCDYLASLLDSNPTAQQAQFLAALRAQLPRG